MSIIVIFRHRSSASGSVRQPVRSVPRESGPNPLQRNELGEGEKSPEKRKAVIASCNVNLLALFEQLLVLPVPFLLKVFLWYKAK